MNFIILGPQGSGKGTQAILLAEKYNLEHVDVGSALREISENDTLLGKRLNEIINVKKELVSNEIIGEVLEHKLADIPENKGIIIDGAPRRFEQIKIVEDALLKFGRKIDKVISINISPEESIKRISKRFDCSECGARLIMGEDIETAKDPCPKCKGKIEQRKDDTPEGVRKRLSIFQEETVPVIEEYRRNGILLEVEGEGEEREIFNKIVKNL